ncbi:hypothetical protein GCM10023113_00670 [Cellulomonas oligotrophica]|uniref:Uncharacterized protein n=1 Tax=Cellulomonas oligotrophica TaxID=931536 RepID=A0ABQ4DFD3_9CELL|nr:hypothetical protein Col01nite_36000 [Cellulomonas oligotrophica]
MEQRGGRRAGEGRRRRVAARSRAVGATIGVALVLVAVASTVTLGGPLEMADGEYEVCAPLPRHAHAAYGVNLPSGRTADVTIASVAPVAPVGITVRSAHLITYPDDHHRLMLDAYPPVEQLPDLWPTAVGAIGATVPAGDVVDLVVELEATGDEASLDGVEIVYTADGRTYVTQSHVAVTLRTAGCV